MMTKSLSLVAVLVALLIVPAVAGADQLPFLLHGSLGFGKMLEDNAPSGGIGLGAGIIYPLEGSQIAIGGDIGFQMLGSSDETYMDYGGTVKATYKTSTIPITAQAYYMFPYTETLTFYGDVGLGLYSVRGTADVEVSAGGYSVSSSTTSSDTKLGLNGGVGARFGDPNAQISFGADLKYHVIMTDVENTDVITIYGRIFYH